MPDRKRQRLSQLGPAVSGRDPLGAAALIPAQPMEGVADLQIIL